MKRFKLSKSIISVCVTLLVCGSVAADPLLEQAERIAKTKNTAVDARQALTDSMSDQDIKNALNSFNKLNWTHILPVNNLVMMEGEDGHHILMDTDARIAIRGDVEVYDLWNKRPIKTLSDAKASWLVTLSRFGIKKGDLASYRFGANKKLPDVTILVDPLGDYNQKLFDQMRALADKYSFEIVLTPLLGDKSQIEATKLWCRKDQEQSLNDLINGKPSEGNLFATCDRSPIVKSLGVASLLHIKGLPHLIRGDGLQNAGTPNSLEEFMSRTTENLGTVNVK